MGYILKKRALTGAVLFASLRLHYVISEVKLMVSIHVDDYCAGAGASCSPTQDSGPVGLSHFLSHEGWISGYMWRSG